MKRLLVALLVWLGMHAGGAEAADMDGRLRVTGRLLRDGNAPRDFTLSASGRGDTSDWVLGLLASAEGRYTAERWQLVGRYDGGGRAYLDFSQENTWVQAAAVEGSHALGPSLGAGLEGRVKDRRGGARAYSDLAGSAFVEYAPDARLALRLRLGAHRFFFRPDATVNFGALEAGALLRYRLARRHALSVSGEYGTRRYPGAARLAPDVPPRPMPRRSDGALLAQAGYTYKGPLALTLAYTYLETRSNSFGESMQRHRLGATVGVHLPWRMMLLGQGALGLNLYPDRIYLSPEIILLDDDEAQNMLSVRLVRPVSEHLDVELSYAAYGTRLPQNGLSYFRQVGGLGLTWRP
ncbi:hypothetical protein [Archangium primigenium]|uniref:hypothetical protein n=1 Tax=[Archangium] primigenium TaxID=2792470 RepID=UPI00195BF05F|nr:hypothetical protein [Archangium primigenium]MBM7118824.1 hypothetical protein [Archangium primigenium]